MFCAKCKFNGFDHLSKCPKRGFDWKESREALQLAWLQSEGHDWFRHPSPQTAPDAQDALSADASPDFVFAPEASPDAASDIPGSSLEGFSDGPLLIEEVTFVGPAHEKPMKEAAAGQPSDADSSKPTAIGDPSGSNEDERP